MREWIHVLKKSTALVLSIVMGLTLSLPTLTAAQGNKESPTIENRSEKSSQSRHHPAFSWGTPGPISNVLHPGSARGAGMREEPLQEIDDTMQELIGEGVMPGAITHVARRGHVVQHQAYGYAAKYEDDQGTVMSDPVAMQKDTIMDLASISKLFTTTSAMILYEQGAFDLDDLVADYLPSFASNGKEAVTIRQLMTHTSGFPAWIPLYQQGDSREDRLQIVMEEPLTAEPGESYQYSDLNMITLGVLIEELSGKRLDQFVADNITDPLNMSNTMYNPPESLKQQTAATEFQPYIDRGIVWGEVHDENAWSLDGVAGHAGVFSTASDLAKFAHIFINDGRYGGEQILKPATIDLLVNNQIPDFPGNAHGLGWELNQGWYMDALSESTTIGHTGYTGTSIVINPNNKTVAILLTNRVHPTRDTPSTNPARRALARQVADAIPVDTPKHRDTWFAGYGSSADKTLKAEIDLDHDATLRFSTWYRIENNYDFGYVEVSSDGENWEDVTPESYTGSSGNWKDVNVAIPKDTQFVRFRYNTDGSVNSRGWYVSEPTIKEDGEQPDSLQLSSDEWEKRSY
ncbi:serine hydrolase domain-containing protein [Thalassobacillus sp. CUG 92003]|uniref:serine hydrolase domain-containing protein n=1 Tax=Thalassobacillus sp. CUG 92003 TaxID=2736641 RepID=UPI0015E67D01|nr:serine hydrolase domain-containing protein [Thalassobacillus sp. CUG 92003]